MARATHADICERHMPITGRCTERWRVVMFKDVRRLLVCRFHARRMLAQGWVRDDAAASAAPLQRSLF